MSYISLPIEQIKSEYDVVVIGSGYGGSIAASRLSRAGQKVCLIERGREFAQGDFPEEELETSGEMQFDFPNKKVGSPLALLDFRVNKEINALAGCGLGGTSLINASVSVLAEPRVYQQDQWPKGFRDDVDGLFMEGVEMAKKYLGANEYPDNNEFEPLAKFDALKLTAGKMGADCYKLPINVTFKDGKNAFGFDQNKCTLCGDCVSGCNENAKNTTLMNYLPDAVEHGAEIFTRVSVKYIEKKDDYWLVHFKYQGSGSDKFEGQSQFVKARVIMLGAGSLGTSEILLRSREKGLSLSEKVGQRFTGNGDTTGFAYNTDHEINGVGLGRKAKKERYDKPGPCIVGVIDMREQENLHDGIVVEEGVVPGAVSATLAPMLTSLSMVTGEDTDSGFWDWLKEKWRQLISLFGGGSYSGAIENTLTYLVNTHDDANGKMRLEDDRLRIDWEGVGEQPVFEKVDKKLKEITAGLGGTYIPNPLWNKAMGHDLITVHPLGGCSMGEDAERGVVNHKGQVFDGETGANIHKGLYVCDGAVIPTALGANPLLTISGIAERTCRLLAGDYGWEIDYEVDQSVTKDEHEVKPGFQFTESMKGYIQPTEDLDLDFDKAYEDGEDKENYFEFVLTIISDDIKDMLENEQHEARMTGTVKCQHLSPDPLTVTNGIFNLFVDDPENRNTKLMKYGMNMTTEEGKVYYFYGYKSIHDDKGFDAWKDTTTLFVTIYDGKDANAPIKAKGKLLIKTADFAKQMTTMKVINSDSIRERLKYQAQFGKLFAGAVFDTYGGIFYQQSYFNPKGEPRKKRPLRVSAPEIHNFTTEDEQNLRLTRYQGGTKGPVILSHGLGVSSKIFSMDTYETNLVEYLFAHNYDVWLLDYRASIELPTADTQFSADDIAKYDYPAAVKTVKDVTGAETVQMVVHCFGATAWTMSMLGGYLKDVRSAVVSQVSIHMKTPPLARLKTGLHIPSFLDKLGIDSLTAYVDDEASWAEKFFDDALRLYPIQKEERCDSPVCHRITMLYGHLYEHDQLNDETHENLHEMFGIANIRSLEHLALMGRKEHVVDFEGEEAYLPHLERMAIPTTFISGGENECFLPESTELTYNLLGEKNGKDLYKRFVIPNYGHIDCVYGKNAARDVYPFMLEQLEETNP